MVPSAPSQAATCSQPLRWGTHENGQIPLSELSPISWAPGQWVQPAAAANLESLNTAYRARFGVNLAITDSYRSYDAQVRTKAAKGNLAATPGCSNHGWARALDLSGGIQDFGTAQFNWMRANAPAYGWLHPAWAEPGGSKPEPWHWEYWGGGSGVTSVAEPEPVPLSLSAPTSIIDAADRISLYATRTDGNLWGASQAAAGAGLGAWQIIGSRDAGVVGRPAVLRLSSGIIAVYARTSVGTIVGTNQTAVGGSFSAWTTIGAAGNGIASDPVATQLASGVIAVYATTVDGRVAGTSQSAAGGAFGTWTNIGSSTRALVGRPALVRYSGDRIGLFAWTADGHVAQTAQPVAGSAFSAWTELGTGGGGITTEPTATITGDRVTVFAGAGSTVATVTQPTAGAPFGAWINLGSGPVAAGDTTPAVIASPGLYSAYVLGSDRNVWGTSVSSTAPARGGWAQIGSGAALATALTGIRTSGGVNCVYGADTNGTVVGSCQTGPGGPFSGWVAL
ncbi:hypothetical protein Cch01nite_23970 [Cellulomonas chitinilytica]|uniref:Peptidase M15B domain-containing protein n=1 Tax=Cellulomonas chitinilytica TaxID=398759 RepID=A0A919P4B5_9CELL|nr:hypothetical protein Cch01nite_23970 [Cellulomonas chitinilytica]